MYTILIIEDDLALNEALRQMLSHGGYNVRSAFSATEGIGLLDGSIDLVLLDIGLPDGDGLKVGKEIRGNTRVPIIFLTAKDDEEDIVTAFDCGADDYLVKPVSLIVLEKHIKAVLRRLPAGDKGFFQYKGLVIHYDAKRVTVNEEAARLSPKEYLLLELLARNRGKVMTKTMILEQVWDDMGSFVEENTFNVTLSRLRKKIEPDVTRPTYIRNVFGRGYTLGGW